MNGSRAARVTLVWLAVIGTSGWIQAQQTNNWNSSTSGNWEDSSWSLGARPGAGQTVQVSNHGWKAVAIGPNTSFNFPQTMSIDSLNITSPGTDTVNTVLLNYAGFQTPLVTGPIYVGTNTALVILQSALNVTNNATMTVVGTVIHGAMSQVTPSSLNIVSTGVYDLTNGTLSAKYEYLTGRFHQEGGSNFCYLLEENNQYDSGQSAVYELLGGDFVVDSGGFSDIEGTFIQKGGTMYNRLVVGRSGVGSGYFELDGGFLHCPHLQLPDEGTGSISDSSSVVQTGGTNVTDGMNIGPDFVEFLDIPMGYGAYKLTNGVLVTSGVGINGRGSFYQAGGVHNNTGLTITQSPFISHEQPGGSNYLFYSPGYYYLSDGTFTSDSVNLDPGSFSQTGGSCQITTLESSGGRYFMTGGALIVSNIDLSGGANFTQTGGAVTQTGTLILSDSGITVGPGPQQFGALQLSTAGNTNSVFELSPGATTLHYLNSSGMTWSNQAILTIHYWNGSLSGGGSQQIFFGSDSTGLTSQQLSQIKFQNPAGMSPGFYTATIRSNGEIVPDANSIVATKTNSWTSPTSGNWEDMNWSLGVLPATGQTVIVTNHGWKAVAIGPNTVANFPQTMTIDALTVTSPGTDTVNTVLLNYVGLQTPLAAKSIYVGTNAALVVLQSALGALITVDGTVIQGAMSQMRAGLTINSSGVYDMTNGTLNGGYEYISGRFRQEGGSNYCMYLGDYGGEYDLLGGDFVADMHGTEIHGNFIQSGGTMSSTIAVGRSGFASGYYELSGGIIRCPYLEVPGTGGNLANDRSSMLQTGGTNIAAQLFIGANITDAGEDLSAGMGSYTLTSGVIVTTNVAINGLGSFIQNGGVHTNGSMTLTQSERFDREQPGGNSHTYFNLGYYILNSGTFVSDSINAQPGNFSQTAGSCQIATLQMGGGQYSLDGGQLTVSNITLSGGANFIQTGGTITQSGTIALADASLTAGAGPQQFGKLLLTAGPGTNATFTLSPGPSALRFPNSSGLTWSNETLTIINWNGSLSGGGSQQIFFGSDNTGLTSQQLSQIKFQNPGGVSPGIYPAIILTNGEIIPDPSVTSTNLIPLHLNLLPQVDGSMQIQLNGAAGRAYEIEVSSNLMIWTPWTNCFNTNGTLNVIDPEAANCPQRFYRAVVQP
jgi:hypothetical protein